MENLKRKVVVFDDASETYERYTIIFIETSNMYGCSSMPFHPNGLAQYSCNIAADFYKKYDADKSDNMRIVNVYLRNCKNLGKRVKDLNTLPDDVKKYIKQINEQITWLK